MLNATPQKNRRPNRPQNATQLLIGYKNEKEEIGFFLPEKVFNCAQQGDYLCKKIIKNDSKRSWNPKNKCVCHKHRH